MFVMGERVIAYAVNRIFRWGWSQCRPLDLSPTWYDPAGMAARAVLALDVDRGRKGSSSVTSRKTPSTSAADAGRLAGSCSISCKIRRSSSGGIAAQQALGGTMSDGSKTGRLPVLWASFRLHAGI